MEKKNIDWSSLGFGYVKTDKRFVANYKDGKWDNAIGVNGNNFTFTVDQKCTITVDFNANTGAIEVYGTGVPGTADISMLSVVVLLALASVTAVILVVNKKKFI